MNAAMSRLYLTHEERLFQPGPRYSYESQPRATARQRVERARPDLDQDSPEFRAAVLLLLASEIGFNVDRIVSRTLYPRDFVARCLRRLVDNGVRVDGHLFTTWSGENIATDDFWLDVQVALGRSLRRIGPRGTPEWAPVGDWVKDFDFRVRGDGPATTANEYHPKGSLEPGPDADTADSGPDANLRQSGHPYRLSYFGQT